MTIVDLSELDTFIRDSLFEVRRGIANSRNATQSNPLLGVMVDLPEKVDFEIMVTSAHQSLSRNVVSTDSDGSSEVSVESQSSTGASSDKGSGNGTSASSNVGTDSEGSVGVQIEGTSDSESSNTITGEQENRKGNEFGLESSSESESATTGESQSQTEVRANNSRQIELHKEANDRASKTFDEEEGTWGGQGQISTPELPGGKSCNC